MEEDFLSDILFNGDYEHVAGLDEMNYAMTQNSQGNHGSPSELEPPSDVDI